MERWFISLIEYDENLYWITELGSHFMKMNLKDNKIEYMRPYTDLQISDMSRSAILCYWNEMLIYVLERGKYIILLDINSNKTKTIEIDCEDMNLNMFSFAGVVNEKLIILPMYHNEIIIVDLNNFVYERKNVIGIKGVNEFVQYYSINSFRDNDILRFYSILSCEMIALDMKNMNIIEHESIKHDDAIFVNFDYINGKLFFLDKDNNIYKYNDKVCQLCYKLSSQKEGYLSVVHSGDTLYFLPFFGSKLLCMRDEKLYELNQLDNIEYCAPKTMGKYFKECRAGEKIYFSMHAGDKIVCIQDGEIEILHVKWPDTSEDVKELIYQNRKMMEETKGTLNVFLNYIQDTY